MGELVEQPKRCSIRLRRNVDDLLSQMVFENPVEKAIAMNSEQHVTGDSEVTSSTFGRPRLRSLRLSRNIDSLLSDMAFQYPHNSDKSADALQSSLSIDAVEPQVQTKQLGTEPKRRKTRLRRDTDGLLSWMSVKSLTGLLGKDNSQPPHSPDKLSHEKSVIDWNAEQQPAEGVRESHTSVQLGSDANNECSQEHEENGFVSDSPEEWNTDNASEKGLSSGFFQEWNILSRWNTLVLRMFPMM